MRFSRAFNDEYLILSSGSGVCIPCRPTTLYWVLAWPMAATNNVNEQRERTTSGRARVPLHGDVQGARSNTMFGDHGGIFLEGLQSE